ncbi:SagB/ThcOx family dehydrogenase [Nonomuraea sp. PA05]|uniref:SagB/ThcOx family dehydrogenase n=1 Tax=Nonomuraea sp. PA05 TaxID=2604466 RepID=UPI0011D9661F|nr:SagB/ThcOx family dehydrogenase [Nonomuraea sp. PA05]TYB57670.1 SagB/ThcOx family dehydrogenase [Nonomuraea sp. PA05]
MDDGHLVWDDYLNHRQVALATGTESFIAAFRKPAEIAPVLAGQGDRERAERVIRALIGVEILVELGSARDLRERRLNAAWAPWSPIARAFHYSTQFLDSNLFLSEAEQDEQLRSKLEADPPPPAFKKHANALDSVSFADGAPPGGAIVERDLLTLLYARRSVRTYSGGAIPRDRLAALLSITASPIRSSELSGTTLKMSPSGGGRHPTELYVYARRVAGVPAGLYHYDARNRQLDRLTAALPDDLLVRVCGDQAWARDASAYVFFTSVFARNKWKYKISRSYRVLHYDVGHLSQTVYLLTAAMGLSCTFTAALRDETLAQLLELDGATELVMGCAVIGTP